MIQHGIINLNKPVGFTSRQALDRVKYLLKPLKVGHAGTLDPLAAGVLVVCLGGATRLIEFVQQQPKRYRAEFLLGRSSATLDLEGEITELENPPIPTADELANACRQFIGTIEQRPPDFSAVWVRGQRAYALARKGREIEIATRPVEVYSIEIVRYVYPLVELDIQCGSGTYIRSLGRDLAANLGTAAVMSGLVRTAIGPFNIEDAHDPRNLTLQNVFDTVQPAQFALPDLPQIVLTPEEIDLIAHGQYVQRDFPPVASLQVAKGEHPFPLCTALDSSGQMVALLRLRPDQQLGPYISFVAIS
ncbi:MAG: tRNA pseudouridine(55) synthase TruB [Planctomycetota bacterium]|nr:tRNA pseudouridine(55) synthase TruB [Planctomycetota bacterium]